MLYAYTVTPLKEDHFEERVSDIKELYQNGITVMPLFSMTLVPEGDPVWDKAGPMAALFCRYQAELKKEGIPAGILVQASLGHGYEIKPNPFQKYENLTDGKEEFICCPEDERFIAHFQEVLRTLAKTKPKVIMLDDDFRLSVRPGRGCVCPLHVQEFNRRSGKQFTKDDLRRYVLEHSKNDPLTALYAQTQTDSLVKAAKAFRAAIDEIDPTIQGINCTSGHYCDSVVDTNPIFAGKGNPTMVRVPNGIYAPVSVRGFSNLMRQAAVCSSKLKKHGIDILLAETDTIPFNRYGKGARHLHAHYTASVLDGLKGAKHWLYRSTAFEAESGKAYRAILAKHQKMYESLADLSDEITWIGANSAFVEQEMPCYESEKPSRFHQNDWVNLNLERMGLPFYYSEDYAAATFLEGDLVADLPEEKLQALAETSLFVDGESAALLIQRGYGRLLGVEVAEWEGRRSGECFDLEGTVGCTGQKNPKKLILNGAETISYNYVIEQGKPKLLSPAVTKYHRPNGKISVVYCGSPTAEFNYMEGFAFLNESRKKQFVSLLKEANALPVYYCGDEEICLRAGTLRDGRLLVSLYNLGYDPAAPVTLYLEKEPAEIRWMQPDGSLLPVTFTPRGESFYALEISAEPMYPLILIIQ